MIRILVRIDNAGMAANVGGAVLSTFRSFDIELPELEGMLKPEDSYTHAQVIGAEILPAPPTDKEQK